MKLVKTAKNGTVFIKCQGILAFAKLGAKIILKGDGSGNDGFLCYDLLSRFLGAGQLFLEDQLFGLQIKEETALAVFMKQGLADIVQLAGGLFGVDALVCGKKQIFDRGVDAVSVNGGAFQLSNASGADKGFLRYTKKRAPRLLALKNLGAGRKIDDLAGLGVVFMSCGAAKLSVTLNAVGVGLAVFVGNRQLHGATGYAAAPADAAVTLGDRACRLSGHAVKHKTNKGKHRALTRFVIALNDVHAAVKDELPILKGSVFIDQKLLNLHRCLLS